MMSLGSAFRNCRVGLGAVVHRFHKVLFRAYRHPSQKIDSIVRLSVGRSMKNGCKQLKNNEITCFVAFFNLSEIFTQLTGGFSKSLTVHN